MAFQGATEKKICLFRLITAVRIPAYKSGIKTSCSNTVGRAEYDKVVLALIGGGRAMAENESMKADEYLSGQPTLFYKAEFIATRGNRSFQRCMVCAPPILQRGASFNHRGINTTTDIFDEIYLTIPNRKSYLISKII